MKFSFFIKKRKDSAKKSSEKWSEGNMAGNFNISYVFNARDRFSTVGRRVSQSIDNIGQSARRVPRSFNRILPALNTLQSRMRASFRTMSRVVSRFASRSRRDLNQVARNMSDFGKGVTTNIGLPIGIIGALALKQSANMETLQVSFESMLGSVDRAKSLTEDITKFTATTPFQLQGVGDATKTLLAFEVTQKQMIPTLRALGDVASGSGSTLLEIASIFGKAKAKGKLMTEEILQLSDKGIPIISVLAKELNVSKTAIFDLASQSKISFPKLVKAFKTMTSEGGIFFEQTKKQSGTLAGLFSTLKDNLNLTLQAIGDMGVEIFGIKGGLEGLIKRLTKLPEQIKAFAKENPKLTKFLAFLTLGAFLLGPLIIGLAKLAVAAIILKFAFAALLAPIFSALAGIAAFIGPAIIAGLSAIAAFIGAPVVLVAALIAAIGILIFNFDLAKRSMIAVFEGIKSFFSAIGSFFSNIFSEMGESISNFFVGAISSIGDKIQEFITAPLKLVKDIFSGSIGENIANFFGGGKPTTQVIPAPVVSVSPSVISELTPNIGNGLRDRMTGAAPLPATAQAKPPLLFQDLQKRSVDTVEKIILELTGDKADQAKVIGKSKRMSLARGENTVGAI